MTLLLLFNSDDVAVPQISRMSILRDLAAGVAAEINAVPWVTDLDFEAVKSWADFETKFEEMDTLLVDVVPAGVSRQVNSAHSSAG